MKRNINDENTDEEDSMPEEKVQLRENLVEEKKNESKNQEYGIRIINYPISFNETKKESKNINKIEEKYEVKLKEEVKSKVEKELSPKEEKINQNKLKLDEREDHKPFKGWFENQPVMNFKTILLYNLGEHKIKKYPLGKQLQLVI